MPYTDGFVRILGSVDIPILGIRLFGHWDCGAEEEPCTFIKDIDLIYCHSSFKGKWAEAAQHANTLSRESKWSKVSIILTFFIRTFTIKNSTFISYKRIICSIISHRFIFIGAEQIK